MCICWHFIDVRRSTCALLDYAYFIDQSVDWLSELQILLYYYRTRVHSALGIAPMAAMMAWEPRDLSVEATTAEGSLLSWHASLTEKCARIRDHVSDLLAEGDCLWTAAVWFSVICQKPLIVSDTPC